VLSGCPFCPFASWSHCAPLPTLLCNRAGRLRERPRRVHPRLRGIHNTGAVPQRPGEAHTTLRRDAFAASRRPRGGWGGRPRPGECSVPTSFGTRVSSSGGGGRGGFRRAHPRTTLMAADPPHRTSRARCKVYGLTLSSHTCFSCFLLQGVWPEQRPSTSPR
jgi:hypothetical protein